MPRPHAEWPLSAGNACDRYLDDGAGEQKRIDLKLVSRLEYGSGAVAMRYEPRRQPSAC